MPMWCNSSDSPCGPHNTPQPHHRIVRIPPGESVVLNSAERTPYLLLVEILHNDLDFDPAKRANKEILKRIVAKEDERHGTSKDLVLFGRGKPKPSPSPHQSLGHDNNMPSHPVLLEPSPLATSSATSGSTFPLSESDDLEEEIDLVEQLYGSQKPLQFANLDIADSIVLPPAPKNRDLDIATWTSSPGAADKHSHHRNTDVVGRTRRHSTSQSGNAKGQSPSLPSTPRQDDDGVGGGLSLDDYSQRMRTAAIMLAQLNANLVREPATPIPLPLSTTPSSQTPDVSSPMNMSRGSWIPGTSWFTGSSDTTSSDHQYQQQQMPLMAASQGRMRLQYAEAQQIRDRIMKEMLALEEERMERMKENRYTPNVVGAGLGIRGVDVGGGSGEDSVEDEGIIRRELNKADPSAVVFSESWAAKKVRMCFFLSFRAYALGVV